MTRRFPGLVSAANRDPRPRVGRISRFFFGALTPGPQEALHLDHLGW